jgi:hypothetical protein
LVEPKALFCCKTNPIAPEGQDRMMLVLFEMVTVKGGEMTGMG